MWGRMCTHGLYKGTGALTIFFVLPQELIALDKHERNLGIELPDDPLKGVKDGEINLPLVAFSYLVRRFVVSGPLFSFPLPPLTPPRPSSLCPFSCIFSVSVSVSILGAVILLTPMGIDENPRLTNVFLPGALYPLLPHLPQPPRHPPRGPQTNGMREQVMFVPILRAEPGPVTRGLPLCTNFLTSPILTSDHNARSTKSSTTHPPSTS